MSDSISIIIPAYREENNLKVILPLLKSEMSQRNEPYEILIVDTMQPMDQTQSICEQHGARYINRETSNMYGDAVRTGIKHATGKYVIFMDADGSHSPDFIHQLMVCRDEYDVVIASRYVDGGATENSMILVCMSWLVNIVYSFVLNLPCKDVSNSFKLYRGKALKDIRLTCNNFDVVEEILFKLKKSNQELKIKEIPFSFKKRMFGETKRNLFVFMASYFVTMIKLRWGR